MKLTELKHSGGLGDALLENDEGAYYEADAVVEGNFDDDENKYAVSLDDVGTDVATSIVGKASSVSPLECHQ